jgi:hypothetical protein
VRATLEFCALKRQRFQICSNGLGGVPVTNALNDVGDLRRPVARRPFRTSLFQVYLSSSRVRMPQDLNSLSKRSSPLERMAHRCLL